MRNVFCILNTQCDQECFYNKYTVWWGNVFYILNIVEQWGTGFYIKYTVWWGTGFYIKYTLWWGIVFIY